MLSNAFAQDKVISGFVYSGSFLGPIGKVHVRMGKNSTKTDYDGKFSLPYTVNEALTFSHSEYNTQKIPAASLITTAANKYYLTPSSNLGSMVLESSGVEEVHNPEFEHVFDYTFLNDTLVALSYMNLGKKDSRKGVKSYINCSFSAFRYGELIERLILPDYIQGLKLSPWGSLYLEGADTSYVVKRTRDSFLVKGLDYSHYLNFISLAYAKNNNGIFFSYYYPFIPQVAHKVYNSTRDEVYLLRLVQNPAYFSKVSDDYSMLAESEINAAIKLEESTGVNHQMFSTYLRSFYTLRDLSKPYAPGFMVNDEVLIFDHMNNSLSYYDSSGIFNKSKGMYHNSLLKEELVKMIQDPFNQRLYTLHNKSGVLYLRQVDTATGATGRPFKLYYPFAENVKVFENYVYYLHKSARDEEINYLVREKLPFATHESSVENSLYFTN